MKLIRSSFGATDFFSLLQHYAFLILCFPLLFLSCSSHFPFCSFSVFFSFSFFPFFSLFSSLLLLLLFFLPTNPAVYSAICSVCNSLPSQKGMPIDDHTLRNLDCMWMLSSRIVVSRRAVLKAQIKRVYQIMIHPLIFTSLERNSA